MYVSRYVCMYVFGYVCKVCIRYVYKKIVEKCAITLTILIELLFKNLNNDYDSYKIAAPRMVLADVPPQGYFFTFHVPHTHTFTDIFCNAHKAID